MNQITFEQEDTLNERLTKIVYIFAGTHVLKRELERYNVRYVKVCKGAKVMYILRGKAINRLVVTL
jgi:hypothetical protein